MTYIIIIALILTFVIFIYLQNNIIDITQYEYRSKYVNNEFKAIQLSDLHSKPFKKLLDKLKKLKPDVIFVTGDYINDKCKNKDKMLDFGKELVNIAPVYYITGNHEKRLSNFDELMNELR